MASEIAPWRYPVEVVWNTVGDSKVRPAHARVDGEVATGGPFGRRPEWDMDGFVAHYPGDPMLPPALRINCRCSLDIGNPPDPEGWVRIGSPAAVVKVASDGTIALADALADEGADGLSLAKGDDGLLASGSADVSSAQTATTEGTMDAATETLEHEDASVADADELAITQLPDPESSAPEAEAGTITEPEEVRPFDWQGPLIVEGLVTGDGRMIDPGALTWRDLPLPLMLQTQNPETGGHAGAVICGSIGAIERRDGGQIWGMGWWDSGEDGQRAEQLLTDKTMRGVSADLDSVKVELRRADNPDEDAEIDILDLLFGGGEDVLSVVTEGRVMGATMTPFPAFQEAYLELCDPDPVLASAGTQYVMRGDGGEIINSWSAAPAYAGRHMRWHQSFVVEEVEALTASAAARLAVVREIPVNPPVEWFTKRKYDMELPPRCSTDGQIYGYAATWGEVHIGFLNKTVQVPRGCDYGRFQNKETLTAEGTLVATGPIYLIDDHAPLHLNAEQAIEWMKNRAMSDPFCTIGDVHLYEDEWGIQMAGALRPNVTDEQIRMFRGSDVSPDWRPVNGRLQPVGVIAVNVSGFITRAGGHALVASAAWDLETDEPTALVASGVRQDPMSILVSRLHAVERYILEDRSAKALGKFGAAIVAPIVEEAPEIDPELSARREEALARFAKKPKPEDCTEDHSKLAKGEECPSCGYVGEDAED